jgi:hypothetical protein
MRVGALAVLAGMLSPALAIAQDTPQPVAPTIGLTDAQKADVLSHNTEASVDAARAGLGGSPGKQVHGEMGVMVGTHGARSIYGAAAIPLGDNAGATVSFESSRWRGPR